MHVSVILPTKDRGPEIEATLASLLRQSYPDYELIVVDNASNADNAAHLQAWAEQHADRARYVREPEVGLNHARNRGVQEARGEIVAMLDDDGLAAADWLAALVAVFVANQNAGAVGGRVVSKFSAGRPEWLTAELELYLSAFDRGEQVAPLHFDDYPRGANLAFRKAVFERCGGFYPGLDRRGDELLSYGEIEMCYRVEQAGYDVFYAPGSVLEHQIRTDRLTHEWFVKRHYWQGRSLAIFEQLHFGRARLLRKLPYRLLRGVLGGDRLRRAQHRGLAAGSLRRIFGSHEPLPKQQPKSLP